MGSCGGVPRDDGGVSLVYPGLYRDSTWGDPWASVNWFRKLEEGATVHIYDLTFLTSNWGTGVSKYRVVASSAQKAIDAVKRKHHDLIKLERLVGESGVTIVKV